MTNEMMDRLRRSLGARADSPKAGDLLKAIETAILDELTPQHAALFESVLEPYVRAAEQLGEDAPIPEIVALAKSLTDRKN